MLNALRPTAAEVEHAVKHVVLLQRLSVHSISTEQAQRFERLQKLAAMLEAAPLLPTDVRSDGFSGVAPPVLDDAATSLGHRLGVVERRIAEKELRLCSLRAAIALQDAGHEENGGADNQQRIDMMGIPDNSVLFGVSAASSQPTPLPTDPGGAVEVSPSTPSSSTSSSSSTTGSLHDHTIVHPTTTSIAPPLDSIDCDGSDASVGVYTSVDLSVGGAPSPLQSNSSETGGSAVSMHRQGAGGGPPLSPTQEDRAYATSSLSTTVALPQHKLWVPPSIALTADQPQPADGDGSTPVKHRLVLHIRSVMRKPQGFQAKDAAMREQGLYCKGCLHPLKSTFSAARLGRSWDNAKFCYYTGYYYCKRCHPCTETSPIPARIVNYWDFTPLSVCSDAKDFLELHHDTPTLCLSAVNPKLYELLSVLRAARSLRIQLNLLVDVGRACPQFRGEFFGEVAASDASPNTVDEMLRLSDRQRATRRGTVGLSAAASPREEDAHVIPTARRYLVEDSEFWSIADLLDLKTVEDAVQQLDVVEMQRIKEALSVDANGKLNTSAGTFRSASASKLSASQTSGGFQSTASRSSGGGAADSRSGLVECDLTKFLKQTRSNMVRHVVQLCRHGPNCCLRRAAHMCPLCKKKDFVYMFDINRTRTCTRCGSCYHRDCWQRRKGHHTACVVCVNNMVSSAGGTNASSPRDEATQAESESRR